MRELLLHMLDETTYLLVACRDVNLVGFLADPTLQRAVVRSLEIIGEASKSLPTHLTVAYPPGGMAPDGRHA